ncbi:MAG: hypothetical protein KTR28_02940 [Micavibrio sp.]|nr:hypothetical protein [Micavibrio sp.]
MTLFTKNKSKRASEKGSALVYILIAIALLAALTFSFMQPSSQQTSSQSSFRSVAALQGQTDTIRSAIQECVLKYSNGDAGVLATHAGANSRFPIYPNSTYLDAGDRASDITVGDIRCPGHNDGTANHHQKIFGGSSGKFMPPPPDLFKPWKYYNDTNGVFFWISTEKSDAFLAAALDKIDSNYSTCEADVIVASGSDVDLSTPAVTGVVCEDGDTCLRIWMVNQGTGPHADDNIDTSCGASDL